MSNLIADDNGVTASGVVISLRCGNPDCNNVVLQAHVLGPGLIRVPDCPACRRGSEFESTSRGWVVRLLPKRGVTQPAPRQAIVPRALAQPLNGLKR